MRQTSPESLGIFSYILGLYDVYRGDWERVAIDARVSIYELSRFLDYAAVFLSNGGNYYVRIMPSIPCSAGFENAVGSW